MMKIDFSGLEPNSLLRRNPNELLSGLSTAPEFQIPTTNDVSLFNKYLLLFCCWVFLIFNLTTSGWMLCLV